MPEYIPSPTEWVRKQVEQIEASGGREGMTLRGMPVVLVTNTGAQTGAVRKTPLMRVEVDGTYVLVASKGGAPKHPVWYFNLLKTPDVLLRDGEVERPMRARLVTDEAERARLWAAAVAAYPDYADYQTKTTRQIPVFAVEPV
ncbi:MAG: nitroreductase family deazaflavin-dependent oxidoreductase [Chloroflexi bacterium HGW-Chloroflexi-9]|nr:MAG: nitroreductase family deazaflavin-dependent oxidoreductase [Chloroflexi bacterium HGW-Chloroflexi-9]